MLKQRVITAVILAPLVIAGVLLAPTRGFAAGLGLVVLIGAWEWSALIPLESTVARLAWVLLVGGVMLALFVWPAMMAWAPFLGAAWWVGAVFWLARSQQGRDARFLKTVAGVMVVVPCWAALVQLHGADPWRVMFLLALVWCTDIGAYFIGKTWGRRRLAPMISPGKTWEGALGGFLAALVFAVVVGFLVLPGPPQILTLALLVAVTVLFSDFGDLFVSLMKRHRGVKDSGHILPGHGGVLDRLDSLFAAAPVFVSGAWVLSL